MEGRLSGGETDQDAGTAGGASPFDRLTSLAAKLFDAPAALVSIAEGGIVSCSVRAWASALWR